MTPLTITPTLLPLQRFMAEPPVDLHESVQARLAREDHRYTTGRRRLIDVIASAGRPMTLPDIVASDPQLAQSSAYRNLDVLERSGVIQRITHGGDHTHFELAEPLMDHHHHLVCLHCGSIADVRLGDDVEDAVDAAFAKVAADAGFTPVHHSLDLHGICASCAPAS